MKKLVYIFFFILYATVLFAQGNETDFYGAYPSSYGVIDTANNTKLIGISYPKSAYAEKILKKKQKLKLTYKERQVLVKYYSGKNLTPQETVILKKALRKREKLNELANKYIMDTLRYSSKYSPQLSEYEKAFLEKAKDSTAVLTPGEKQILRMIQKHQKNLEKIKQKTTLTEDEKALLEKSKSDSVKLSVKEKIELLRIRQKKKKISKIKLSRAAQAGVPVPIKPPLPQRIIEKTVNPRSRPSSYIRKVMRLQRRYALSDKEKQAYNKKISGVPLMNIKEKYLAARALNKKTKYEEKKHRLDEKYFWSLQDKETRKRHKQHLKKSQKSYFWKILDRKIKNLEQTLKVLFS